MNTLVLSLILARVLGFRYGISLRYLCRSNKSAPHMQTGDLENFEEQVPG